jgi:hypothetical protein
LLRQKVSVCPCTVFSPSSGQHEEKVDQFGNDHEVVQITAISIGIGAEDHRKSGFDAK